jgi:hypothetical protein
MISITSFIKHVLLIVDFKILSREYRLYYENENRLN